MSLVLTKGKTPFEWVLVLFLLKLYMFFFNVATRERKYIIVHEIPFWFKIWKINATDSKRSATSQKHILI